MWVSFYFSNQKSSVLSSRAIGTVHKPQFENPRPAESSSYGWSPGANPPVPPDFFPSSLLPRQRVLSGQNDVEMAIPDLDPPCPSILPSPVTVDQNLISAPRPGQGILGSSPSPTLAALSTSLQPLPGKPVVPGLVSQINSCETNPLTLKVSSASISDFNWASRCKGASKFPNTAVEVSVSGEGNPRVKVPNAFFERRARLHSDYIVGIFYGNAPSYGKVWAVLNYLWGKDQKVKIHTLSKNAFLFHIPSAPLRNEILQHELWRVGDSPFFVTEWKASFSLDPPSLQKAPLWATLNQVSFDLLTDEGLSFLSRPLGKIVDAKPFSTVSSAEIKVIINLKDPLPKTIEVEREDREIVVIFVSYPWLPPL
ncbi:PREDICTED: uncharacterized protein LOC104707231 [Camelina sativa]|uniref:Uncharacterized protein LOC104707231 n=1 Tax=Camelina sativa TaxID=90675 RepID=A0ABM0T714_CAMSA|nr:PREDICTED: uncharacterized protein LOC104707231 [Camelina sativa]